MLGTNIDMIRKLRGKKPADLARFAGVSRQSVSRWLNGNTTVDLRSSHLKSLAQGLGVPVTAILEPLPVLDQPELMEKYKTLFLWDRLFPELSDFAIALVRNDPRALARLVQVEGLYRGAKIAGPRVWSQFHEYKKLIRPVRRAQLEVVWKLKNQNPTSS